MFIMDLSPVPSTFNELNLDSGRKGRETATGVYKYLTNACLYLHPPIAEMGTLRLGSHQWEEEV